jgi:hypothetical protein
MNHPWQQPVRPMEYLIIRSEEPTRFWYRVIFIRVTDDGFEVMGENGTRWNVPDILIRDVVN